MITRYLFLSCFALLVLSGGAFAEGTYQRTNDDKTMVWNNAPKPGDTASWDGGRDEDGYASGFGTLTWFSANSAVYARYFGNMVHGKLDGPVNVHSKGKTAHAIFVAGTRSSRWKMGRAPSAQAMAKRLGAVRQKVAKAEKEKSEPISAPDGLRHGERITTDVRVEGKMENLQPATAVDGLPRGDPPPSNAKLSLEGAKTEASAELPALPAIAEVQPEKQTKENIQPPTSNFQLQLAETPAEGPAVAKIEKENVPPASSVDGLRRGESSTSNSESFREQAVQHPIAEAPARGLVGYKEATETKNSSEPPPPKAAVEKGPAIDGSVRAMIQPPSSLRAASDADTSGTAARLTKEDVMGAADTAARAAGYDLNKYERPKADYNAAEATWSLVYDRKPMGENGERGEPFSVTVDDKTKKASIVAGL